MPTSLALISKNFVASQKLYTDQGKDYTRLQYSKINDLGIHKAQDTMKMGIRELSKQINSIATSTTIVNHIKLTMKRLSK